MALGKKHRSVSLPKRGDGDDEGFELGHLRFSRSFGRKRILISNNEGFGFDSCSDTPLKKLCGQRSLPLDSQPSSSSSSSSHSNSSLEALPQDILIRILCGVDHDDLNQLSDVSKTIRDAALVAKQWHFAYSTPKKVRVFRGGAADFDQDSIGDDDLEAPNAPRQSRPSKSRLFGKKLDSLAVNLFD